jgi:hypothetical protein
MQTGIQIHKQSASGKLPSNVHIAKTLQLNCYYIAFWFPSEIQFPELNFLAEMFVW